MTDTNKNCNYCYSCNYCNSCNYCYSCDYCNSCNYCYSCNSCDSCDYCYSCDSCDYCNSCNYCDYCYSCDYCNSCNYCYSCYGLRMSEKMIFCLGEGKYESKGAGYQQNTQIFNTPVTNEEYEKTRDLLRTKNIKLPIATWIKVEDIEKPTTTQKQLGGYLKTLSYHDAWKEYRSTTTKEDKQFFRSLPHFDSNIFEKITSIKIEEEQDILIKNGKKYRVQIINEIL